MKYLSKMNVVKSLLIAALGFILIGCGDKEDKPSGSNERSIISISFDGQIGNAEIVRTPDRAEVRFQWATLSGSLSSVEVKAITVSPNATASVQAGGRLNFDNSGKTATITVTAENRETLEWTVIMDPVEIGIGSAENEITGISFVGQAGEAKITTGATAGDVEVVYSTSAGSLASVEVQSIEISADATASVQAGGSLNFDNHGNTATITVTAQNGTPKIWTVKLIPVTESLVGKWNIRNTWLYGGSRQWDHSAVFMMTSKMNRWQDMEKYPALEYDNVLEFILEGVDDAGNTFGKVINHPGEDGLFADYQYYPSKQHYKDIAIPWDLNNIYRAIPTGEAKWKRKNIVDGLDVTVEVTFIFPDETERVCLFGGKNDFGADDGGVWVPYAFPENSGDGRLKAPAASTSSEEAIQSLLANMSFMFDVSDFRIAEALASSYDDDDKYLGYPHYYWVEVEKQQ